MLHQFPLDDHEVKTHSHQQFGYTTQQNHPNLSIETRYDHVKDVAKAWSAQRQAGLEMAMVLANPIPAEHEIPANEIEKALATALTEMKRQGISGKRVTPFLLAAMSTATQGRSLQANIKLVENNARLAASVAAEIARLGKGHN